MQERAHKAEVIVVGFPRFFGYDVSCGQAIDITLAEAQALNAVADTLDPMTAARATEADLTHVSVIDAFTGHDVCADEPWILGLFGVTHRDAYHPNTAEYQKGDMPLVLAVLG